MAVLAYICTPVYHCYLPWPLTDRDHGMFIKVSHLQCQAYGSYQLHPIFIWGHSSVTHSFVAIFLCISLLPLLRPISILPSTGVRRQCFLPLQIQGKAQPSSSAEIIIRAIASTLFQTQFGSTGFVVVLEQNVKPANLKAWRSTSSITELRLRGENL